jgi:transposase-like protein
MTMTMTTASLTARAHDGGVADGDPAARPARRRFSAQYKLAILEEYEASSDSGAKGALLRREGLYSSHIVEWRRARDTGAISGLAATHRKKRSDAERELEKAKKKIERLAAASTGTARPWRPREKHQSSWRGWQPRARTTRRGSSRDRRVLRGGRAPARDGQRLCGDGAIPGDDLPPAPWPPGDGQAPSAGPAQQAQRCRGCPDPPGPALSPLRRRLPGAGVLHPARRGYLPGLGVELLPDPAGTRLDPGAPPPGVTRRGPDPNSSPTGRLPFGRGT